MSEAKANGLRVLGGEITMRRRGAWDASLDLDSEDVSLVASTVTITIGDLIWSGTSLERGVYAGHLKVRVVGGKGGLSKATQPRFYASSPARIPFKELLVDGGEALSSTSSSTKLATSLPFWTRVAAIVSEGIEQLVEELDASWRVLADGTVWVGTEDWPVADVKGVIVVSELPQQNLIEFWSEAPTLRPGQLFRGKRVGKVVIKVAPDRATTEAYFETDDPHTEGDPLLGALGGIVRHEMRHVDLFAIRGGRVVAQNADGTLELLLDDPAMPGMSKIPIVYGVPGITAKVKKNARVHVEFEGGSPTKPRAIVVDSAGLTELTVKGTKVLIEASDVEVKTPGGARAIARVGDPVMVISTAPGTPAVGQIAGGNNTHRG